MAVAIHAPHLPHLDEWSRHRTMVMAGIAAAAIAVATVFVLQQTSDDTSSSTTAASAAVVADTGEFLGATPAEGPGSNSLSAAPTVAAPSAVAIAGPSAAAIAAPTKQALASSAAVVADTGEFLGATPAEGPGSNSLNATSINSSTSRQGHHIP